MKTSLVFVVICFVTLVSAVAQEPRVELARELGHATSAPALTTKATVIVTISAANEFYVGNRRIQKDQLGATINELLKGSSKGNRIVYIAGNPNAGYGTVVDVLHEIRAQRVKQFGLIVNRGSANEILRGMFLIEVPMMHYPDEDVSKLKPNPLTLVVMMSTTLQLRLNSDDGPRSGQRCFSSVPRGLGSDPHNLQKWLECIFDYRRRERAYKIGMETRTDVPEEQRIEKTVFIKAPRAIRYGDVLSVVNGLQGAGANPIGLQIDDLPD